MEWVGRGGKEKEGGEWEGRGEREGNVQSWIRQ